MSETICPYRDADVLPLSLGDPVADEIRTHVEDCPVCRERLERFQAESTVLRRAAQRLAAPAPAGATGEPSAIGKYCVVGTVATTPQASFYRAMHPKLSKEIVVKLYAEPVGAGEQGRETFLREARALADLVHPNLARVRDANVHDGRPYLVMDVQGVTLQKHAARGPTEPRQAAGLVVRLARAAAAARREGAAAQSLAPTTVLLDDVGEPRLIDLGIPRDGDGTSAAVPALGELLYLLLVGREPFAKASAGADRSAQREELRAALRGAGVPPRLETVCLLASTSKPGEGYADVDDFAAALERTQRGSSALLWLAGAGALLLGFVALWAFLAP